MPGAFHAALPTDLRRMAQACGMTAVMTLIRWRGNTRFYVPEAALPDRHELVALLGRTAADWLVSEHGGQTWHVPRAVAFLREQRDYEIRQRCRGGDSAQDLALAYGLHLRQIFRIVAAGKRTGTC